MPYADPEKRRANNRRNMRRYNADGRRRAINRRYWRASGYAAVRRDRRRTAAGLPPAQYDAAPGPDRMVDARPFAEWLAWWREANDCESWRRAARVLGVSDRLLREVASGQRERVSLYAVSRALDHADTGLWELYDPETLAPV